MYEETVPEPAEGAEEKEYDDEQLFVSTSPFLLTRSAAGRLHASPQSDETPEEAHSECPEHEQGEDGENLLRAEASADERTGDGGDDQADDDCECSSSHVQGSRVAACILSRR